MFVPSIALSELMFRAAVIYFGVFLLLRLMGKRQIGELAPFDLLVLLILSECLQNALVADDKSLTGALLSATTLLVLNQMVTNVSSRFKKAERVLEGTPRVLVRHGKLLKDVLAAERITVSELLEAMRREGCTSISNVRYAILEPDGDITIGLRSERRKKARE